MVPGCPGLAPGRFTFRATSTIVKLPAASVWHLIKERSGGGVLRVAPDCGWLKAEHDVALGNACAFKLAGDIQVGVIHLNPDFAVDDFEMDDELMNALVIHPADFDQRVAVRVAVEDGFMRRLAVLRDVIGDLCQGLLDDLAVLVTIDDKKVDSGGPGAVCRRGERSRIPHPARSTTLGG